ncbi:MAG: SHOCT domain-containing protein, partial [Acholeplasmataceae bacterium]|nr:SHOCT domain-containing protein [Acholeplasmataceae bacterium]
KIFLYRKCFRCCVWIHFLCHSVTLWNRCISLTKKSNDTLVDSINKTRTTNIYDALHELENLYGDGILTKDEYESKKQELLMRKG